MPSVALRSYAAIYALKKHRSIAQLPCSSSVHDSFAKPAIAGYHAQRPIHTLALQRAAVAAHMQQRSH